MAKNKTARGGGPAVDLDGPEEKSRSRKKRESTALQRQGASLAALSPEQWKLLPLSAELAEALEQWRGMKSHEARRRHMQYIGRLMRELEDPGLLLSALDGLASESRAATAAFRQIEGLRDKLLHEDQEMRLRALDEALEAYPGLKRPRLAHLMEAAFAEREKKAPPKHGRELFRYLRQAALPQDG
ncbi:DUF615 domain-containing protein [Desulfovibrio sp. OttesenSCG-928-A18]|nr:DUF615 domain-containing protein [Desulfovibrio sp. OttesenSCG-928-A18]